MLRSMNAAISGLKSHQLFMDVIGNNIANVNTTGFKGSRTTFQSMLTQTLRGAVAPAGERGGLNPQQIGLGANIASVDVVNTQGALTTTSKVTDLAIQGDGMFVVTDGNRRFYTRDGAFDLGADATLVSGATGLKVMGWEATTDDAGNVAINTATPPTGPITIPTGQAVTARASRNVTFNGNLNGASTERIGSGIVESTTVDGAIGFDIAATDTITLTYKGQTITTQPLAAATADTATLADVAADLQAKINQALQTAGITTADEVVVGAVNGSIPGEAVLSFQAPSTLVFGNSASSNSRLNSALRNRDSEGLESVTTTMTAYDTLGAAHEVTVRFDKVTTDHTGAASPDTWKWTIANLPADTTVDGAAGNGQGTGYLKFDANGRFQTVNTVSVPAGGGAPTVEKPSQASVRLDFTNGSQNDQDIILDFGQLSQLQGSNTATAFRNDGYATGTLTGFVVGTDGVVTGSFSNGVTRALGQIALASFPNTGGLTQLGESLFTESANSGGAIIGAPGAGGHGQINAGQLEMSNVDLAAQFTDMIRAQRGFQANSRIITTSDEMLQDLVNLKR